MRFLKYRSILVVTLFETVSSKEMIMNRNYNYLLVWLSITVASEGRPDGVRGCGTSEASFIPTHGNSRNNESLPIYIRAIRNGTDWSGTSMIIVGNLRFWSLLWEAKPTGGFRRCFKISSDKTLIYY